jgi:C1A family cysteine protease
MLKKILFIYLLFTVVSLKGQQLHQGGMIAEDLSKVSWIEKSSVMPYDKVLLSSVDNSAHIPPVLNQGSLNSCVAFAVAYYYNTFSEWKKRGWSVTDPSHQFSPTFMYNIINGGNNNPTFASDAAKLMIDHGIATLQDCPYNVNDNITWPTESQFKNAMQYRWEKVYSIDVSNDIGIEQLKQYIAAENVANLGIWLWGNFDNISNYDNNFAVADKNGSNRGAHATTIVGYDDNHVTNDGLGAFKCVNSWGTSWGTLGGFFWMSYKAVKDVNLSQQQAFYADTRVNYTPNTIATVKITHDARNTLPVRFGIGTDSHPLVSKNYLDFYIYTQGAPYFTITSRPMPSTNIVFDLTDYEYLLKNNKSNNIFFGIKDNKADGIMGKVNYLNISMPHFKTDVTYSNMPVNIPDDNTEVIINLSINNLSGDTLKLISPTDTGAYIGNNSLFKIKWNSVGIANVDLFYSIDAGLNWNIIQGNIPASQEEYSWSVPDIIYDSVFVRIANTANPSFMDVNMVKVGKPLSVNGNVLSPRKFILEQNYPNPFNPSTVIRFSIPLSGMVSLKVYDLTGNEIATLINEFKNQGTYTIDFNKGKSSLTSGVYFYRLVSGNYSEVKKMTLIK